MIARTGPRRSAPGAPSRWSADNLGESLVLAGDLENRRAELEDRFPPLAMVASLAAGKQADD